MDRSTGSITIIVMVLGIFSCVRAQNAQEIFLRANKTYRNKQWSDALSLYSSIEKKGRAVWYNMGNCFYKMGNPVKAVLCWKRAEIGASSREYADIEINEKAAYKKLDMVYQEDYLIPWERWAHGIQPLLLQIIFLLCWYGLWIILMVRPLRRIALYSVIIGLVCALIIGGILLVQMYYGQRYEKGIVVSRSAHLLSGPHEGYHAVCSVPLADELLIYEKRPGWYKVAGNGSYGWIPFRNVEVI